MSLRTANSVLLLRRKVAAHRRASAHLSADQLSLEMRILTVADIFDPLEVNRPHRDAMPLEKVFGIVQREALDRRGRQGRSLQSP